MISIVTPVFRPQITHFSACVESLKKQTVGDWEWVIVDDGSHQQDLNSLLESLSKDDRVAVRTLDENRGISEATNAALEICTGEFVAFLDQDDLLAVNAIEEIESVVSTHQKVDFIYSDENKIDDQGRFSARFRKPSWSPERLRGQNYCSHLSVIRTDLIHLHGGLISEFDGAQDHELLLRLAPHFRAVVHIPKVLYHWRISEGSTSSDPSAKPNAASSSRLAVKQNLGRCGIEADTVSNRAGYVSVRNRRSSSWHPKVSIVIPTAGEERRVFGRPSLLVADCIRSINRSSYSNFEIVVVHDQLVEEHLDLLQGLHPELSLVAYSRRFNFSEKCNIGALNSNGEVLIFLNDDTTILTQDWMETFIAFLAESDVGLVGPKLLLEDGRLQSAGHWNAFGAHHVAPGLDRDFPGPFGCLTVSGERSGLTFACIALRRSLFDHVGGLCEQFPGAFNDVDFCNKVLSSGRRLVWTPEIEIRHFESLSRDPRTTEAEIRAIYRRWKDVLDAVDPFLPGFTLQLTGEDFADSLIRVCPSDSPHHAQLSNLGIQ